MCATMQFHVIRVNSHDFMERSRFDIAKRHCSYTSNVQLVIGYQLHIFVIGDIIVGTHFFCVAANI